MELEYGIGKKKMMNVMMMMISSHIVNSPNCRRGTMWNIDIIIIINIVFGNSSTNTNLVNDSDWLLPRPGPDRHCCTW